MIIYLVDIIEILRAYNISFLQSLKLAFWKFPLAGQKIINFTILFASCMTYLSLTKNSELVILRAAGLSVWQFLLPTIISSLIISILYILVINPAFSIMLDQYYNLDNKISGRKVTTSNDIATGSVWLGQNDDKNNIVIYAKYLSLNNQEVILQEPMFLIFDKDNNFLQRIDANIANLQAGNWLIKEATISDDQRNIERKDLLLQDTNINIEDIRKHFIRYETVSFWRMYGYITSLEKTGLTSNEYRLYFYNIILTPLYYIAMAILGVILALPKTRRYSSGKRFSTTIFIAFISFFCYNVIYSIGLSGNLNLLFATILPALITILLSILAISFNEDK